MKTGKSIVELAQEIERRANSKKDMVASTSNMEFQGWDLVVGRRDTYGVNAVAHEQIAAHTEIPARYYDRMRKEAPDLLANNINTWFAKYPAPRMVRVLDGDVRAFLSNRYRIIDNEDVAEAVLPIVGDLGLDIMSCQVTDKKLYIKAVDKRVNRELAKTGARLGDGGHTIARVTSPAITISNSEVGFGALSVQGGVYDSFCSNLATFGERSMRRTHIGSKHELVDDELFALLSDDTKRLTDEAIMAQVRDVVRVAFDRARFDALVDRIEGSQEDKLPAADVVEVVKRATRKLNLTDGEGKGVLQHLIEGGDLSRLGLYNSVTRMSADVESYDRASDLERIGASVIDLPKAEWRELVAA
jgi:hypothetical protein